MSDKCFCGGSNFKSEVKTGWKTSGSGISVKWDFMIGICQTCGVVKQLELPFSNELEYIDYYERAYPPTNLEYEVKDYAHDMVLAIKRLKAYKIPKGKKLLDIGSGSGAFIDACRKKGIEAYGCEIGAYQYSEVQEFTYAQGLQDVHFPTDHFGYITCHDVAEHVLNPAEFLSEMFRILSQEGSGVIEIPNFYHPAGEYQWKAIEHIWYFTIEQFRKLLKDIGFQVTSVQHPVKSKAVFYVKKPIQNRPSILLPPGIGDDYWVLVKLQAFLKREGLGIPDIHVLCKENKFKAHLRSFPFIEMFPFVNATWNTVDFPKKDRTWRESYVKRGRTIFKDVLGCDYFISYNGALEAGNSLVDSDPDLKCNWDMPRFVSLEEENFRKTSVKKYGKYIVFYFVFVGTFKLWEKQFPILEIIESIKKIVAHTGYIPVFVGGTWDSEDKKLTELVGAIPNAVNLIGKTSFPQVCGLLRGSEFITGHPSGLTMTASAMGKKTLMLWNDWHRYGFHWNTSPPDTKGKTYFIENTKGLTSKRFIEAAVELDHKPINPVVANMDKGRVYTQDRALAASQYIHYKIMSSDRVLNVSSGCGALVDECRDRGTEAYGCEEMAYDYGNLKTKTDFIYPQKFVDIHFPTDHFDKVFCFDTFGYMLNPVAFILEMFRVTKQRGECIIVLSKTKAMNVWFYNDGDLKDELIKCGFRIKNISSNENETSFHLLKPDQKRPKILVPPGIGDAFWSIVKLEAFLKQKGLGLPDIFIAHPRARKFNANVRAFPFIEMFPFIKATWKTIDTVGKFKEVWRDAYHRDSGKAIFKRVNGCDYFICYNSILRYGMSLAQVDQHLESNWSPPSFISLEQRIYQDDSVKKYGNYFVCYFTFRGTNRETLDYFSIEILSKLINDVAKKTHCIPIFVGAAWDSRDEALAKMMEMVPEKVDLVGKTNLAQLFGLMKGSKGVFGIPSGIAIMAAVMELKTLMLWNDWFHRDFAWHSCPPHVKEKTYQIEYAKDVTPERLTERVQGLIENESPIDSANPSRFYIPATKSAIKKVKKDSMIAVFCVLKSGGDYNLDYVMKLRNMIKRNSTVPYDFICLTDLEIDPRVCKSIPLVREWAGWWSKIELFRPGLTDKQKIIYFDLDTLIVKNIDDILSYAHSMTALRPWNRKNRQAGLSASGMMAWRNDASNSFLFDQFKLENISNYRGGDQEYISKILMENGVETTFFQTAFSGIYSYKRNCRKGLLSDARIVCFHGKPRPHEMNQKWVKENWR